MTPLCSIIILNWNKPDLAIDCYRSCLAQTYPDREIILFDNASTDDSVARFERECPQARVIRHDTNVGPGGGNAVAARQVRGEFILFLSNDTILDPDVLEKLMAVMRDRPDCGSCCCTLVRYHNPNEIDFQGYVVDRFGIAHNLGMDAPWSGEDTVVPAWAIGATVLIRREAYEKAGGYDPLHFTLYDDTDLCWRIRLAGYKLYVRTGARVIHHHFATLSKINRNHLRFMAERHALHMLLKNYSAGYLWRILPQYAALQALEMVYVCLLGKFGFAWADLRAIGWNLARLGEIRRWRRFVRQMRTITDAEFQRECWPGSVKIQWALSLIRQGGKLH